MDLIRNLSGVYQVSVGVWEMIQNPKKEAVTSALLIIGVFYFSFMILDRVLSVMYGFNFQPYGTHMPLGFTIWGHILNGTMAAFGLFITFKLYDYGREKNMWHLQILALSIFFVIGAIIPYMNDAAHIQSHGMGNTIPQYMVANDLYVFSWGVLIFRVAKSIKMKVMTLTVIFIIFLVIHFAIYAPMFPDFYWS